MVYTVTSRSVAPYAPGPRPLRRVSRGSLRGARLRGSHMGALGVNTGQALELAAPVAGIATSAATATALGSFAGPVGAAVGAIVGIIGSLFAAHAARAAGAKTENEAINAYLPAFDSGLQMIFQQANNGTLTASDAISACQQLLAQWWSNIAPYQSGPGRADASHGGTNCGNGTLNSAGPCSGTPAGPPCNKSCTAGCCVGCQDLYPTILQAMQVFSNPKGGTITACNVAGSSYGATGRPSYQLTYTPPAAASVAGVANALTGSGGNSMLFFLALAGVAIFLLAR